MPRGTKDKSLFSIMLEIESQRQQIPFDEDKIKYGDFNFQKKNTRTACSFCHDFKFNPIREVSLSSISNKKREEEYGHNCAGLCEDFLTCHYIGGHVELMEEATKIRANRLKEEKDARIALEVQKKEEKEKKKKEREAKANQHEQINHLKDMVKNTLANKPTSNPVPISTLSQSLQDSQEDRDALVKQLQTIDTLNTAPTLLLSVNRDPSSYPVVATVSPNSIPSIIKNVSASTTTTTTTTSSSITSPLSTPRLINALSPITIEDKETKLARLEDEVKKQREEFNSRKERFQPIVDLCDTYELDYQSVAQYLLKLRKRKGTEEEGKKFF